MVGGRKSYISATRGFLAFMKDLHPSRIPLPPMIEDLVLWASFFKNAGTFSTYCSAIRWATEACSFEAVFENPVLKRAKTALKHVTVHKERRWIGGSLVQSLMKEALRVKDVQSAMLFAAAYVYMARVPSELLTWQAGGSLLTGRSGSVFRACVQTGEHEVRVHLQQRNNAQSGDTVRRVCSCSKAPALCPVHVLGPWLRSFGVGAMPFQGVTAAAATRRLRRYLEALGVADVGLYSLHAFRRDAANDMKDMGCTLAELLEAGGWTSRACLKYLKPEDLDLHAVIKFVAVESESERDD